MKAAQITFGRETVASVWDEIQPLLRQHYDELTWRKEKFTLDPDRERYLALETAGRLRVYSMRRDGILVGYSCYLVSPALHYKGVLMAVNDVLYVSPEERGLEPIKFMRWCEKELKNDGVQCITLHIKKSMNWGRLAERMGYEVVETNHLKWIGDHGA